MPFTWNAFAEEDDDHVVELADGRVLFLPGGRNGRAYRVRNHKHGRKLVKELRAVQIISTVTIAAVGIAAKLRGEWTVWVFAIPAVIAPALAKRVVAWGLDEVTDHGARHALVGEEATRYEVHSQPENKPIVPR